MSTLRGLAGPELPAEHDGQQIVWEPWREHLVGSCGRPVVQTLCKTCAYEGARWTVGGRVAGVHRAQANYCPSCGEFRVYWRIDPPPGQYRGRLERIESSVEPTP